MIKSLRPSFFNQKRRDYLVCSEKNSRVFSISFPSSIWENIGITGEDMTTMLITSTIIILESIMVINMFIIRGDIITATLTAKLRQ
jgi:hypothetical protein